MSKKPSNEKKHSQKQTEAAAEAFVGDPDAPTPILAKGDIEKMRSTVEQAYPDTPVFQQIEHDRDHHFPVYLMALPPNVPDDVEAALKLFRMEMEMDGLPRIYTMLKSRLDLRRVHLWFIPWIGGHYRPIGMAVFTEEERYREEESKRQGIVRWWLSSVWLNHAQRRYHIFSNSFAHFKRWHPGFVSADNNKDLDLGLHYFPEHRKQAGGIWAESDKKVNVIRIDTSELGAALRPPDTGTVETESDDDAQSVPKDGADL